MTPSGSQTPTLSSAIPTASGRSDVVDISDLDGDPLDEVDDFLDLVSQSDDESEFADGYKLGQMVDTGTVPPFGISSLPRNQHCIHCIHGTGVSAKGSLLLWSWLNFSAAFYLLQRLAGSLVYGEQEFVPMNVLRFASAPVIGPGTTVHMD